MNSLLLPDETHCDLDAPSVIIRADYMPIRQDTSLETLFLRLTNEHQRIIRIYFDGALTFVIVCFIDAITLNSEGLHIDYARARIEQFG